MSKSVALEIKYAELTTDFAVEWASKLFGEEAVASLPVRQAGKNKGKPKGYIVWRNAQASGYCRECQSPVKEGQLVDAWIGAGPFSSRSDALVGMWMGRMQSLAGSRSVLFEEGRKMFMDAER